MEETATFNCPACHQAMTFGQVRCPACGTSIFTEIYLKTIGINVSASYCGRQRPLVKQSVNDARIYHTNPLSRCRNHFYLGPALLARHDDTGQEPQMGETRYPHQFLIAIVALVANALR